MKVAVLTRILSGHELCPSRWSNWRKNRLKGSGHTCSHQVCKVRHATFGNPGTDECPRRCIQTYDDYLRVFLHFAMRVVNGAAKSVLAADESISPNESAKEHANAVPSISCGT